MYDLIHDFDLADAFPIILKVDCTRFHHSRQSIANLHYMDCRDTKHIFVSRKKKSHEITILSVYPF
jgi:hypothetical protein